MCGCDKKVNKMLEKSNTRLDRVSLLNFKTGKCRESIKIATCRSDRTKSRTKVRNEMSEAIPPAYSEYIGRAALAHINLSANADAA